MSDQPTSDQMRAVWEARRVSALRMLAGSQAAYDQCVTRAALPDLHHTTQEAYQGLVAEYQKGIDKYQKRLEDAEAALAALDG